MTPRIARWIGWSVFATFIILSAGGLVLQGLSHTYYTQTEPFVLIFLLILIGVWMVIGVLIISRHPQHPVGWLLCAGFFTSALDMLSAGVIAYDTYMVSGSLPGVNLALIWLKLVNLGPLGLVSITLMMLFFPDGKFLSPGWRKLAWAAVITLFIFLPIQSLEPGPADPAFLTQRVNPLGVGPDLWGFLKPLLWAVFSILILCYWAAFASLLARLRNSDGDVRQQVKWLLAPVGFYGIGMIPYLIGLAEPGKALMDLALIVLQIAIAGIVISVAIAIFKYRLYDIDLILSRTLVYGSLTVCVAGLYILLVSSLGMAFQTNTSLAAAILTAILVVMSFKPLLAQLQRGVDRLVPVRLSGAGMTHLSTELSSRRFIDERNLRYKQPATDQRPFEMIIRPPVWMRQFLRTMWLFWAAMGWGIFLIAISKQITTTLESIPGDLLTSAASWVIAGLNVALVLARESAALVSLLLAGVLYLKRPKEGMALFLSYFLVANSMVLLPLAFLEPYLPGIHTSSYSILQPIFYAPLLIIFLSAFPNARLFPFWTRGLVLVAILFAPLSTYLFIAQDKTTPASILAVAFWFVLILAGLYAQSARYRRISTAIERLQTKWVLFGFAIAVFLAMLLTIVTIALPSLLPGTTLPWWAPIVNLGWRLAYAILPVSLTIAVMRYHLFEIDLIINRTLVYSALTAGVVSVYTLIVGGMGLLFQTQGNFIIALLATGLVAVIFQPLRERLQRSINRMIYGERDDPIEALSHLGVSLETALPPDQVLPALVETIAKTLKLPFVGIAVQGQPVAIFGQHSQPLVAFPLTFQGDTAGELLTAPRSPDESFTPSEMRLLRNLARQAGAAVRNAQLTADLQRSRQTLVTAREEERHRLRRDLHDGLGPALASVIWQVDSARDLIPSNPTEAVHLLESSIEQAQAALADIRRLVYGLRPPALDELGLVGALEQAARKYPQGPNGVTITIEANGPLPALPAAVEVATYRIIQEALKNAIEHGKAKNCHVCLTPGSHPGDGGPVSGSLTLTIRDDGLGLPEVIAPGVGLTSMRERAEELGGMFKIEPQQVGGTRIEVCLPLG